MNNCKTKPETGQVLYTKRFRKKEESSYIANVLLGTTSKVFWDNWDNFELQAGAYLKADLIE